MDMFVAGEELFNAGLNEENENRRDEIIDTLMRRYAVDRPAADLLCEVSELQSYLLFVVDLGIPFQRRIFQFTNTVEDDLDVLFCPPGSVTTVVNAEGDADAYPAFLVAKYVSADMAEEIKTALLDANATDSRKLDAICQLVDKVVTAINADTAVDLHIGEDDMQCMWQLSVLGRPANAVHRQLIVDMLSEGQSA